MSLTPILIVAPHRDARSGQVIGVYGVGDKGSKTIVATDRGGEGSVTAHRDGNFHRHGDSAHVAGGKESYSKDGKISPSRIK
ncbi:MAG: hypothetical protein RIC85_00640 [Gammaproteobacteria bacterium]